MMDFGSEHVWENGVFAVYDIRKKSFRYSEGFNRVFPMQFGKKSLWETLGQEGALEAEDVERLTRMLERVSDQKIPEACRTTAPFRDRAGREAMYSVGFLCVTPGKTIVITFRPLDGGRPGADAYSSDDLTGLYTQRGFFRRIDDELEKSAEYIGNCAVVYFDVQRFKMINNMFGMEEGDRLLCYIADRIRESVGENGFGCHFNADRFGFFIHGGKEEAAMRTGALFDELAAFDIPFEILCNAGIYMVEDAGLPADIVVDCAIIAQGKVKGSYGRRFCFYSEDFRKNLLSEQEIAGQMRQALETGQFVVYYQPQYNHSTGMLIGAEALVRWNHPEKGLIAPGQFLQVFEGNGFIIRLDYYVFEEVCVYIKKCLEQEIPMVPVSVNLSRYDIFNSGFIDGLEIVRQRYDVPTDYIRIEITESSALGNSQLINEAIHKMHSYGYTVEMDDFGSGYSSLNILEEIDFDVIKLDMRFQRAENGEGSRGGIILSSIVRMVNWLRLPLIAEGVETMEQADFLRSIGCDHIQGYLYSKPISGDEFRGLLKEGWIGPMPPNMSLIETMDADKFWSAGSLETLIFSNYVGAAAIFEFRDGKTEILRVNKKYLHEFGMNLTERDVVNSDFLEQLDGGGRETYLEMLMEAIQTGDEQECETWRSLSSKCCGSERICVRSAVRMLGECKGMYIFYAMVRNITAEKKRFSDILDSERRFKMASEQANIYYWEYTVATREMRPCFRCMRDLGMPALMTDYPESAIEMGIFPPEVADMYRDWHRQIEQGVPSLEAVMPLTVGRVPFIVRYTTEFDDNGKPVKAYGSATLVVDGKKC